MLGNWAQAARLVGVRFQSPVLMVVSSVFLPRDGELSSHEGPHIVGNPLAASWVLDR